MTRLKYIWMFTIVFFFGLPSVMQAQKKEIAAARDQVKEGKDLNKAQASMEKLLKDSANLGNKKIWVTLFDAVRKQYEQGNEKLYLKQKYDTAQLFNLGRQMFLIAQGLDSVEMVSNRKGKVDIEYRKAHAEYLKRIRPNIYNGGVWFCRRRNIRRLISSSTSTSTVPTSRSSRAMITRARIHRSILLPTGLCIPAIR